jgi:hypothetical protein
MQRMFSGQPLGQQQQQQQQQQGCSQVAPWHEQLLLSVGVPAGELKLAASLTVRHAEQYSLNSALQAVVVSASTLAAIS